MSRLPRKCGILDITQPCGPPLPVTGIALLFYFSPGDMKMEVTHLSCNFTYVHEHDSIFICSPTCTVFPQNIGRDKSIKCMRNVLRGNVCGKGVARMIYWAYLKYCGFLLRTPSHLEVNDLFLRTIRFVLRTLTCFVWRWQTNYGTSSSGYPVGEICEGVSVGRTCLYSQLSTFANSLCLAYAYSAFVWPWLRRYSEFPVAIWYSVAQPHRHAPLPNFSLKISPTSVI
jgi:hypothetical protein